jgi:hypothetical protein
MGVHDLLLSHVMVSGFRIPAAILLLRVSAWNQGSAKRNFPSLLKKIYCKYWFVRRKFFIIILKIIFFFVGLVWKSDIWLLSRLGGTPLLSPPGNGGAPRYTSENK